MHLLSPASRSLLLIVDTLTGLSRFTLNSAAISDAGNRLFRLLFMSILKSLVEVVILSVPERRLLQIVPTVANFLMCL